MLPAMPGEESEHRVQHWPAFDGLRAFAVLAVMSFHVHYPTFLKGGYTGVDVFFVLSGFLITSLLMSEHDRFAGINYTKFYARRALRLFPALAVVILVVLVLVLADSHLANFRHATLTGLPFVVLYIGNWASAFGTVLTLGLLSITWTLAIEEQFYLLWPLGLSALLRRMNRTRIAHILIGVAVLEMVGRLVLSYAGVSTEWLQYSTVTHSDGLLMGSALALLWSSGGEWKAWPTLKKLSTPIGIGAVAVLAVVLVFGDPKLHLAFFWIALAVLATTALLISLIAQPASPLNKLLSVRPLQWIGKRSYGFYLWHFPILGVVFSLHLPVAHRHTTHFLLVFGATFVIAGLSYRIIERPFLNRKTRFAMVNPDASTVD